ncbi:DNA internalization-related competence protein ComEC/Rec2 [Thioalkalivibrio sp. ALM2T]|uniref:DNA internalization-related competence protein ComEC/Rec2 n=1 Tax=Thioalkalivibrio sp. ALM2T TaxID=1158184 RepID=UPI00037DA1E3|nr:DNA internalization-related competence protein ComEC/Rec2 [Thioalkalivibrio sp. ALM2T]
MAPGLVLALLMVTAGASAGLRRFGYRATVPWAMALGVVVAWGIVSVTANTWLEEALAPSLAGEEVTVLATVTSLPEHTGHRSRFRVTVEAVIAGPEAFRARELLVAAYPARPEVEAGTRGHMALRLRPAEGPANPGGFDRAGWFYREGLHGSATLLDLELLGKGGKGVPAAPARPWRAELHRVRGGLRERLEVAAPELRHPGLVQALVIGDRQGMTAQEWQAFLRTGTNHLMAISGLHVGLVAGFVGLLSGFIWSGLVPLQRVMRKAAFMALAGLAGAAVYAALAGFSIPTQRALIMLAAFMAALLWRREAFAWRGLMLAAIAVVLWQPTSVLAPGFWFSFGAVAVILLLLQGRSGRPGWREAGSIQVMLALAMLPLSLAWFHLGSWVAPVANLVAVPVISLLVLPVLLVGAGLAALWAPLGQPFLHAGDGVLALLVGLLDLLSGLPVLVDERRVPLVASLLGGVAVLVALQPRLRLGAVWVVLAGMALALPMRPDIEPGAVHVLLLDVGNGQSALLQTRNHNLLFDAGPGRAGGYSAGEQIVVPTLRAEGVRRLDRMILSHEHAAHAGGSAGVRGSIPVVETLRRVPAEADERACEVGERWEWDAVRFEVLHPPPGWDGSASASCVLAVETAGGVRLLLSGGLGGLGEAVLMRNVPDRRASDLLVLPRGAGADSLSRGWLEDAPPRIAWASTDGRGRGLEGDVRERLQAACVPLQETGLHGALRLEANSVLEVGPGHRARHRRLWQPALLPPSREQEGCIPTPTDETRW